MGLGRQDFSGKKVSPQEADAVVADLKKHLMDIADRWVLYEGTMVEWWASFCVEEAVGHWARFFGGALRNVYKMPEDKIVYFRVHAQADLEEHDGVMAHADLDWTVLKKMLEEGRAET